MIPISVLVVTKNEEKNLAPCLSALIPFFQEVIVVDSASRDQTKSVAIGAGAPCYDFVWNGQYPKKRGWCLEHIPLAHDWVFFVDADEIVTADLVREIHELFSMPVPYAGFFIMGQYKIGEKVLKHGDFNSKLALFDRTKMCFPVVDDLDIPGMGEIEGHYQPVFRPHATLQKIGELTSPLIHLALQDERGWAFRHEKYARWEAGMNMKKSWPVDPVPWREWCKRTLRASSWRPEIMFCVGYILKLGFLDGGAGLKLARKRYDYLKQIRLLMKNLS